MSDKPFVHLHCEFGAAHLLGGYLKSPLLTFAFFSVAAWCCAAEPKQVASLEHDFEVSAAAFSPDNKLLVAMGTRSFSAELMVWDVAALKNGRKIEVDRCGNGISELRFSPDGKYLSATGYVHSSAHVWDLKSGREVWTLDHEAGQNFSHVWSPNGKTLAVVNDFGSAHLWDMATGKRTAKVPAATMSALSAAFSPDGTLLAIGTREDARHLVIWDLKKQAFQQVFKEQKAAVMSLAFTSDGKQLVAGADDGTVTFWDVADGKKVAGLEAQPKSWVKQLFLAPGGRLLMTRGWWGESDVRIWDLASKKQVAVFDEEFLGGAAWSPDAKLAAVANNRTLKVWDTSSLNGLK